MDDFNQIHPPSPLREQDENMNTGISAPSS